MNRNISHLHCLCLALYPSILLCNFTHMDLVFFLLKILQFFVIPVTDILLPFPFYVAIGINLLKIFFL